MTRVIGLLTPEALLSAPRRSPGVPNVDASKVLSIVSTYDFHHHTWLPKQLTLLEIKTHEVHVLYEHKELREVLFLDPTSTEILVLQGGSNGQSQLVYGDITDFRKTRAVIVTIDGPVSNLRIKRLGNADHDKYVVAFSSVVDVEGALVNPEKTPKQPSSAQLYRSVMTRHWDTWKSRTRQSLFTAVLSGSGKNRALSKPVNLLRHTRIESPMVPFGGADNYDLSSRGVLLVARDPALRDAFHTKCCLYYVPMTDFTKEPDSVLEITLDGYNSAYSSPALSPDGTQAAVLAMKENGYESDKNHVVVLPDILHSPCEYRPLFETEWFFSPSSLVFSKDGRSLLFTAETYGKGWLYCKSSKPGTSDEPHALTSEGGVSSVVTLQDGSVFVTRSSLTYSTSWSVIEPTDSGKDLSDPIRGVGTKEVFSNEASFGLHRSSIRSMWSPASKKGLVANDKVHSWIVLPPAFDESKKHPVAVLVHGGPQGAWGDDWSTRWNPQVFAAQGYVVILPNPTGSTGYGQPFTDAIQDQWGGYPYLDLVNAWDYAKQNLKYIDPGRAVLGGASYGGYMTNWIQGQALGREFQALFTHDGVFSTLYEAATDEVYFPNREFGGSLSSNRAGWERWDPSRHTAAWKTPHLIIHSERDFRLTVSDGLAAFNALQENGTESQLLVFPDENHWVLQPENSLKWHQVVLTFINTHVGLPGYGQAELAPIVMDPFAGSEETEHRGKVRKI